MIIESKNELENIFAIISDHNPLESDEDIFPDLNPLANLSEKQNRPLTPVSISRTLAEDPDCDIETTNSPVRSQISCPSIEIVKRD